MLFYHWWVRQLAKLVPSRLTRALAEAGDAVVLDVAEDRFALSTRRKGLLAEGALEDLQAALGPDLPQLRLLRIPQGHVLRKKLSLPAAARRDLATVLGFEIDRETPFEKGEVYWDYRVTQGAGKGRLDVDLVVMPRRVGDMLVATAQQWGFVPTALEVPEEGRPPILLWLEAPNPLRYYQPSFKTKLPMTAVYGMAAALLLLPFGIQQARLFLADRTIASLQNEAHAASALNQAANRRVSALAFMNGSHLGQGRALEILAAATKALPDDSFLTSFSVHEGQVTMAGSSEAAAKLIGSLAASPAFRDPVFDSAVLQSEEDDLEKFTISAKLAAKNLSVGAP